MWLWPILDGYTIESNTHEQRNRPDLQHCTLYNNSGFSKQLRTNSRPKSKAGHRPAAANCKKYAGRPFYTLVGY